MFITRLILPKYLLAAVTIITVLAIFVPLSPNMPASGLDSSGWQFAINEAVAKHLNFGKDIIFTFGPYASIYTQVYHPATDHLMLFGSLFLGLCYAIVLLYLKIGKKIDQLQLIVILAYMIIFFPFNKDVQFFSYPLILIMGIANFIEKAEQSHKKKINIGQLLIFFIILTPLGLLPLIKGSFLLLCITFIIAIVCYFLYHDYRILSLITVISPIVSMLIFWVFSGQSVSFLLNYLSTQIPIISGYTEAMALRGNTTEIVAYLLVSIAIVCSLIATDKVTRPTRLFLSTCVLLFLFIVFKAGFTRHDTHSNIAVIALLFTALITTVITGNTDRKTAIKQSENKNIIDFVLMKFRNVWLNRRMTALVVVLVVCAYIFANINMLTKYYGLQPPYLISSWNGLHSRLSKDNDASLRSTFEHNLDVIKQEYSIPHLQGTTDIYAYAESYLLASDNQWNPRPIVESYSAYTPLLARIDEQHLRTDNAPDNIVFSIQTIDYRLPSLDDGLSWPALLDNYTINKIDNDFKFAYLHKKPILQKNSIFHVLHDEIHKIGENIVIPSTGYLVYAEINLKPTLLGKLLGILYKPPQLLITLKLKNGSSVQYRVIANMMESGFFISPLINDSKDFAMIASSNAHYLDSNIVESLTLSLDHAKKFGKIFWNTNYQLKLKAYQMPTTNNSAFIFPFDNMVDFPEKYTTKVKPVYCNDDQNQIIDQISGSHLNQPTLAAVTNLLSVNGWLVFSAKDGIAADETFVTLTGAQGLVKYIKTHPTARPDIKTYLKQPALPTDVGFTASVDVTKLAGDYKLGLAKSHVGKLELCSDINIPITIKPTTHHESQ